MKPILFSTEMIRAILDKRKTVMRRVMKPQPLFYNGRHYVFADDVIPKKWEDCDDIISTYQYQPGDILYMRETWKQATIDPAGGGYALQDIYLYKADEPIDTTRMLVEDCWHPSIHMPREAARIFLRVMKVWVERLQDITFEQIKEEGISEDDIMERDALNQEAAARWLYKRLWDSTIKPKDLDKYGWEANPWCFVTEFEQISKENAMK